MFESERGSHFSGFEVQKLRKCSHTSYLSRYFDVVTEVDLIFVSALHVLFWTCLLKRRRAEDLAIYRLERDAILYLERAVRQSVTGPWSHVVLTWGNYMSYRTSVKDNIVDNFFITGSTAEKGFILKGFLLDSDQNR